jgi:hypothetical protein
MYLRGPPQVAPGTAQRSDLAQSFKVSPAAAARSPSWHYEERIIVVVALVLIAIPIWLALVIWAWRDSTPGAPAIERSRVDERRRDGAGGRNSVVAR